MANKKITELTLKVPVTDDISIPGDDGIQTYRLTTAQLKAFVLTGKIIASENLEDDISFVNMPKVGIDAIIEKGSNSNGEWVKFSDGTMLCTVKTSSTGGPTGLSGSIYASSEFSWTFPNTFVGNQPHVTGVCRNSNITWICTRENTLSSVFYRSFSYQSVSGPTNVSFLATGRWK